MANDTINLLHEYLDYIIAPPMEKRVIFQRTLKLLKAKEQMKGQDKSQEIAKLKSEIEEREKDLFYADSWEQSGQIRVDIEKMKAKLNILTNSEKDQENGKKSILGAIKEYQAEDKQKPKKSKEKRKETER